MSWIRRPRPEPLTDIERVARSNCPESHEKFEAIYLPQMRKIAQWFGPLLAEPMPDGFSPLELAVRCASSAMQIIPDSNYRAWAAVSDDAEVHFQRLTWLRALVFGTGQIFARRSVRPVGHRRPWNPFHEPLPADTGGRAPTLKNSNFPLHDQAIEQGILISLFPGCLHGLGQPALAMIDTFAPEPNPENPIHQSLRRGIRKTLLREDVPIPWFWETAIHKQFPGLLDQVQTAAKSAGFPVAAARLSENEKQLQSLAAPDRIKRFVQQQFDAIEWVVNGSGALMHKDAGRYYAVFPKFFEEIAENVVLPLEETIQTCVDQGWLDYNDEDPHTRYAFVDRISGKVLCPFNALRLTEAGAVALLGELDHPDNSAAIQVMPEPSETEGRAVGAG